MNPSDYTAYPQWTGQEYRAEMSAVKDLQLDIAELKTKNSRNRASITKLGDIMDALQDQHNTMLQEYNTAKERVVELESELSVLRAANKKMSDEARLVREGSRDMICPDPRWRIRNGALRTLVVVKKQKRGLF